MKQIGIKLVKLSNRNVQRKYEKEKRIIKEWIFEEIIAPNRTSMMHTTTDQSQAKWKLKHNLNKQFKQVSSKLSLNKNRTTKHKSIINTNIHTYVVLYNNEKGLSTGNRVVMLPEVVVASAKPINQLAIA